MPICAIWRAISMHRASNGGAQSAYFKALELDGTNPDYAYNLAISLEHIGQPSIALTYYRLAFELANTAAPASLPGRRAHAVEQIQAGGR